MQHRYASMDTLRAFAIFTVFMAHTVLAFGAPEGLAPLQFGGTGVDLFFVLSGWLLGGQLFKELEKSQNIDLLRFWSRRWLRTVPAYGAILLLTLFQRFLTKDNVSFPWSYFFFTQNYFTELDFFYVSWSLCVEEQFYLFVAPFVLLMRPLNSRVVVFAFIILVLVPELCVNFGWFYKTVDTHIRVGPCIAGVALAYVYYQYFGQIYAAIVP